MAISLGDIKKKKITVSPIKNTNTNNATYNVAPPVNYQREKQAYNLGEIKNNNITVTPLSERPKSKILAPTPQETMTQNNINNIAIKNIVSGGIQNDIHNMNMANIGTKNNKVTFQSAYKDTGKKYGDYYYDNYESFKDKPIYERDGKYFLKTNKGYEPIGRLDKNGNVKTDIEFEKKDNSISKDKKFTKNQDVNLIGKYEEDKKELQKAESLGYKDNLTKITSKEYDDAQKVLKEYKEQMKMSDKDYKNWLKTGKLPKNHGYVLYGDKLPDKAENYRKKINSGEIKKYDQQGFDVEKQIYMDTHNMSDDQKQQYISFITGKNAPTQKNNNTFFKGSSVFDDGYQFGDVTKATLGTVGNAGISLAKGVGKFVEGTGDFATNLVGSGLELMASDKDKKDVKEFHNNTWNIGYKYGNKNYWYDEKNDRLYDENWNRVYNFDINKMQKRYTYANGVAEFGRQMKEQTVNDDTSEVFDEILHGNDLRKMSVLGNKSEAMLESMGQALPLMGAGGSVGGLYGNSAAVATTSGLTFSSTYGNAKTEAIRNGATEKEAMETAFVQASAETISEQFFDSIPGAKSAGWGEKLVGKVGNGVEKYLGSKTAKIVTKTLDISGEGFEEIISNMLTAGGNDIVHYFDKDYSYGMENQSGNILDDMTKAMTSQDSMDSFVSAIITSAILNGGSAKVNSVKINKIVKTYAQEYNMSFDEAKSRLKISDDGIEFDTNNINQKQNTPNLPNNSAVQQRNINNNINNQVEENVQNNMPTIENNAQEKYSNVKPPMVIKYQATDNEKINSFRQSAVKEGMIDSKKTTNAMNVIEKVIEDKNYNVKFDRTITNLNGKSVDGKININKNGEIEIALNPNSDRAVEFLLTHEVTHAIETKELRGIILDYAKKNSEFNSSLKDLQKTYGTTNVSDEVIADISGQILGNQEFINSLSLKNTEQSRGVISKIYHSIQRLLNKLTTKGRYRNFVEDLESKWREAYRLATNETAVNNLNDNEKLSIMKNSAGKYVKADRQVITGNNPLKWEKQVENYINNSIRKGKDVNIMTDNGEILTITKDTAGKAKFRNYFIDNYGNKQYMNDNDFYTKLLSEVHIDELGQISRKINKLPIPDYKNHSFAKNGFDYRTAYFEDFNGDYYKITMSVGKNGTVDTIYNVGKLEQRKRPVISGSSVNNGANGSLTTNNVPQSNQNVKSGTSTKYSMQTKENNTQELDNSSFSFKEKSTYRGSHQIENAKTIVDLNINEIESKVVELNGYLTNQDQKDLNKLKKMLKSPNEKVKIYRASPVNELNSGDWVTTDKSYAKNIANTNGGKVYEYEVTPSQLWYPDNVKDLPSLHRLSSFQYIENTNIQTTAKDSQGRALSKDQQEYFKDSKIRNDKGELLEVYHGTRSDFTVFDKSYLGSASGDVGFLGDGFYFATHEGEAGYYGSKKMKVYLNVTNPYNIKDLQKYKGMNLRGESSNPYIEIKNLVDMNPEWGDIKVRYGNTYGDIANITDDILNSISVEDLGKTENGHQYKVNIGNDFDIVNTINNYSIDELKADAFTKEMRNKFGFINSSDVIQDITDEARMRKLNNQKPIKTFSEVLEENGYDGVIQGEKASDTDEIVVFNPNQVKNVDNTNPTTNDDIRYSQKSSTWQEHLENNYKPTGTRTYFDEITYKKIAPINPNATTNQNKVKPPIAKEYQKNTIEEKIENSSIKSINNATKIANKYLDLSKEERQLFQEKLKKYKNKTYEEISNGEVYNEIKDIVREFSIRPIENIDEEMKSVKREIRNRNIKIDDNLKNQIDDYNEFRKSMFGKLKLTKDGMSIDSLYNELSNIYPYYFDSNITTEADMLYELADFMDKNVVDIQRYNLTEKEIDDCTSKVFNEMKNGLMTDEKINSIKEKNDKKENKLTHKEVKEQLLNDMNITAEDLSVGDDIKSLNFQLTDPIRVNEKVFGRELGKKVNEVTIEKTKHNEAERTRWLNSERDDIKELEIKPRSKESAAVQKYGEKQYVNKYGETVEYGDKELMAEFPNVKTQEKIKRASQMIRNKYDKYIDQINETLTALGYDEIPKRPDYMRHFQELGDIFSQTGVPFNLNDMSAEDLPTDINGLTEFNKPGKNWFASAQKRYGNKTTYDAITGIDGYLEGASNLIFHTEDIQRYRALSGLIRDSFGKTKGFENLDNLSNKEALKRIDDIQHNKLSKYVAWLDEQANSLANKKGAIDRGTERILGRRGYTALNTIKKQVGSNMTGFNVRSAMTNFISSTIAASKTNKIAMIKGTISTIRNMFHNDGFINKSDFLTSRFGSDSLSPKLWNKISNAGQILMKGSDYFTSNQIVRSKYYEGLQRGMTETEAIKYADDFGSRVMGDRSKGATAEAFNSKTLGLLTQFQLETNNQWQFMVHDSIMDYEANSKINGGLKAGATMLFQLGQLCAYSYFFNEFFEALTGSRAAFDPIDILLKLLGWGDDDKDKSFEQRMKEANSELVDAIPFASLFGKGGRMPISEALVPFETTYDYLTGKKNSYGGNVTLEDVKNDTLSTLPYYLLPTGYSQIKKTTKGLSMFNNNKEIKGSYTKSGRLRFPVKDTIGNKIQAGLFGEYASKEAREYFSQNRKPLTDNQQNIYKYLDIPISDYWKINKDINNLKSELKGKDVSKRQEEIFDYIDNLDISQPRKDILKKLQYKSYKDGDNRIIKYINSSNMSTEAKKEILKKLGLDK